MRQPLFFALALASAVMSFTATAQVSTERVEGLRDNTPRWHALTGARIVLAPGKIIEKGTLVLRDGRIAALGADVPVPAGARVWSLAGRTIYPGFIDLASTVGVPASMRPPPPSLPPWLRVPGAVPTPEARAPQRPLATANRFVRADQEVSQQLDLKADEIKAARELGFTTVLASPASGVFRGQSALLNLSDATDAKSIVLNPRAASHVANEYERSFGGATYPGSAMGAIALVRQTLYNARWYGATAQAKPGERMETSATLAALQDAVSARQPVIYQAEGEEDFQRVAKIRDEFALRVVLQGNGYEYRRAATLKALGMSVITPLNFPIAPDVDSPDSAIDVPLEALQHWEQAPSNLNYLAEKGVEFALTAHGLRDAKTFWPNVREAVRRGAPRDTVLAALTQIPARLIGAEASLGSLEVGKIANVVVSSGDLFSADNAEIELTFVDGKPYTTPLSEQIEVRGTWAVTDLGGTNTWTLAGTRAKPTLTLADNVCEVAVRDGQLIVTLPCGRDVPPATEKKIVIATLVGDTLRGSAQTGATLTAWSAQRTAAFTEPAKPAKVELPPAALTAAYPAGAFGISPPTQTNVLVKNATIWTSAALGRLEQADIAIRGGKITAIGKALAAPAGAVVLDAAGKHVTPGIIDAHSHTAIAGGVNEPTSSITAEVRVGDVLDATDVSIYRQLGGGVTAANLLHGSANTIGGQNQVIKFRWGSDAEGLKFAGAIPGIKFALGENVKQSNWGTANTRYPQSRLGVEQILRDGFQAASHYRNQQAAFKKSGVGIAPRRDLQLDTLVEILEKKRVVHIHSYRADEILMFTRIAKEFGITVATFQHVLEGYKVADAMAGIGAGGSTFSDWWGYKMEVYDAIPYNAALMHNAGVLTTFNSDSDELARRLNTEAAKAVRYGGVAETEALKFVTLNAAKQLRIDDRVGSLEVGKDADFVLWNDHPLSTNAVAEQTWIEGRKYFDRASDLALRESAAIERNRLIAKAKIARASRAAAPLAAPPTAPRGGIRDVLDFMAMQNWLHQANQFRDSYWTGGNWHECREDAR